MIQQQQGDVWIEQIQALPIGLRTKTGKKKFILAEGETHGHKHQLIMDNSDDVLVFENDTNIFLDVKNDCTLVHEEHAAQIIKSGFYKIGNINEFDYPNEKIEPVLD